LAHLEVDFLKSEPFLALGVLLDKDWSFLDDLADRSLLLGILGSSLWILSDGLVSSGVVILEGFALEFLLPSGELSLEGHWVFFLKEIVVLLDVDSSDVLQVLFGSEDCLGFWFGFSGLLLLATFFLSLLHAVTWESLLAVRDQETTIASTLHSTENSVSSGGTSETNVEVSLEWSSVTHIVLHAVVGTVDLVVTLVHVSHLLLDQKSSGAKEANTVGTSIVGETALDSVFGEFLGVSGDHGLVALNSGVDDGADDSLVGSSDDESVLFGVVLVLVVDNKSLASVVVGLSMSSSAKFGLVAL